MQPAFYSITKLVSLSGHLDVVNYLAPVGVILRHHAGLMLLLAGRDGAG